MLQKITKLNLFFSLKTSQLFVFLLAFSCFIFSSAQAQINIPNGTTLVENFNSMAASAPATLPADWRMATNVATPDYNLGSTTITLQASSGSPTTGGTYNWGSGAADRAAGVMTSGSFASPNSLMAWYQNTHATDDIVSLAISYNLERYRRNTAIASLQFYYSLDGIAWIPFTGGDIAAASLPTGASTYGFSPLNLVVPKAFTMTGLNIPAGANVFLRWNLFTTGSNSQGIGVDDVNVTATFCKLPIINTQPVDVSICPGANASFSITASGVTGGYQWQESIDNGATWNNLANVGVYSNVTTAVLNLTAVPVGMNGYQYRCVTKGAGCPGTSDLISTAAVLRVGNSFSITTQPSNSTVCYGTNTSFSVVTTVGASFYQWQVSTDGGVSFFNVTNTPPYSNATTATLNITSPSTALTGNQYQCVISNGGCAAPDPTISNIAILTVNGPVFVVNPGNTATCVGNNASFTVSVTGVAPTYQWQVSTNGGGTWSNLANVAPYSNVTTATLNLTAVAIGYNTYQYRCVVSIAGCPGSSTAGVLTVSSAPVIFTQPANVVTPAGTNALFSVNAVNVTTYVWEESTDGGATWNAVSGAPYAGETTSALTVNAVTALMDLYQYRCILTGCGAGVTITNPATLFISATGGTIFAPGDLVFVGFDSYMGGCGGYDNGDDKYYIANMVDILPGTKFKIVNSRFESGAAANVRTNRWYGAGNDPYQDPAYISLTWYGATIPKGSIICLSSANPAPYYAYGIKVNGVATTSFDTTGSKNSCNLNQTDPDQLYIMQGDFVGFGSYNTTRYNIFTGKVLFGMTNGVNWVPFTSPCSNANAGGSARQSRLPDDIECFNLQFTTNTKVAYYPNSALHNGSARQLLGSIFNLALWQFPASTTCLNITEDWTGVTALATGKKFTFIAGNPPGYWVGDVDVNWFNCKNWETFTVPDPTVDVTVPVAGVGSFNCLVDTLAYASTAKKYGNQAQSKKMTVSGRSLIVEKNGSLTSYSDFLLTGSGTFDMDDLGAGVGQFSLVGNWTNQLTEASFFEGDGIVQFISSNPQTINNSGGLERFYKINSIKAPGTLVTMNANVDVLNSISLDGGVWDLNSKEMHIFNPATNAIVYVSDYILSEKVDNSSKVTWDIGTTTGAHLFPFGRDAANYIPFTFNLTGGDIGSVSLATYGTLPTNLPWPLTPQAVTNLNSTTGLAPDNRDATVDRFWQIDKTGPSGTATLTFSYAASELPITPYDDPLGLLAQRYTKASDQWLIGLPGQTAGLYYVTVPGVVQFGPGNPGSPWTLAAVLSPLPVELLSFGARAVDNKVVEVDWITASEINNDYFTVLRSKDGFNFDEIGKVRGSGTTTTISKYKFTDDKPLPGRSYYKLLQTDYNLKTTESKICGVTIYATGSYTISGLVSSNNALEFLVSSSSGLGNFSVELYDFTGRLILRSSDYAAEREKQISIPVSDLQHAVYLLKVNGSGGNAIMKVNL